MPRPEIPPASPPGLSGWRGVALIAITYVYFLIFAQFAFLKRLATLGIADTHLKAVMAAMAIGGILLSLAAPRLLRWPSPALRLRTAFLVCAAAAFSTLLPLPLPAAILTALLIGCGLGLLTVTLVTHLRLWIGSATPLLNVGLGTGIGYFLCNVPPFFTAAPQTQAAVAAFLCLAGIALASTEPGSAAESASQPDPQPASAPKPFSFPRALACFTALIWLDSAAFFIIQNTPTLKAGTWEGNTHLWLNATLHLAAALAAVWLLRRPDPSRPFVQTSVQPLAQLLALAFATLAAACLLLLDPRRILLASVFYPIGVSLYSVALVAYPSLLSPAASVAERGRRAGWIYALAGWGGSAMGIGMGQNLGHVPWAFVLTAALVILGPLCLSLFRTRPRELAATALLLLLALGTESFVRSTRHPAVTAPDSAIARGRRVYISEGCISCHSQYVRPRTADVVLWGPTQTLDELRRQQPPLIGNRRQGPDLSQVGSRRSPLWLRAHFFHPAEISHASFMPAYEHLFDSQRGTDLLAYLTSLQGSGVPSQRLAQVAWQPAPSATASPAEGQSLFLAHCATCHAASGVTRRRWLTQFRVQPPLLPQGPYRHLEPTLTETGRRLRLAQIVKFGLPGTDMAGHEYFTDRQIASLSLWLAQNSAPTPGSYPSTQALLEKP